MVHYKIGDIFVSSEWIGEFIFFCFHSVPVSFDINDQLIMQRMRETERERERQQEKSGKGVGRKRLARRFQNYHFRLTDLISGSVSTTNFNDAVTWQLSVLIWFGILWHSIDILLRFHKAIGIHSHKWHIKILRNSLWGFLRIPERVFEMLMGVH